MSDKAGSGVMPRDSVELPSLPETAQPGAGPAAPSFFDAYKAVCRRSHVGAWLPPIVAFLLLAIAWDVYATHHPYVLPTIGDMWRSLKGNPGMYWDGLKRTFIEIVIGAGSGILVGLALAEVMAQIRIIERALMPMMVTLMVTPVVAIAPALVIAFGFGPMPKYLVTGIVVFFPVLVNTLAGLKNVDPRTADMFTTLHASRWERFRYLQAPGSLPFMFAGLRIAMPLSVVGVTIAEIAASSTAGGLGSIVQTASSQSEVPIAWTAIIILCLLGITLSGVLSLIRARVLWWDNESARAKR